MYGVSTGDSPTWQAVNNVVNGFRGFDNIVGEVSLFLPRMRWVDKYRMHVYYYIFFLVF